MFDINNELLKATQVCEEEESSDIVYAEKLRPFFWSTSPSFSSPNCPTHCLLGLVRPDEELMIKIKCEPFLTSPQFSLL